MGLRLANRSLRKVKEEVKLKVLTWILLSKEIGLI